ncbi:hypothetical protein JCM8097_006474 [Rhodosporidiobolus ruineniae]
MPKRGRNDDDGRGATSGGGASRSGDEAKRREGGARLRYKGKSTTAGSSSSKRHRSAATLLPALSLEGSLSEEILLRCLSFLTAHDLVTVSRVSGAWHRLAQDPQLWRSLYLRTYASAAVRRQAANGAHIARTRPWRELFKISTNWRSGSAKASTLGKEIRRAVLAEAPPELALASGAAEGPAVAAPRPAPIKEEEDVDTLLQFHHSFFFTASRTPVVSPVDAPPTVTVHQSLPAGDSAVVGSFSSFTLRDFFAARPDFRPSLSITEMRLDENTGRDDGLLLALFYSTGQFALFRLTLTSSSNSPSLPFSAREVYTSLALGSPLSYPLLSLPFLARAAAPFDPVRHARLHYPLLVTCSEALTVRFHRISECEDGVLELEEAETPLQASEQSWNPVVLSLERVEEQREEGWKGKQKEEETEERFRVSLAYSTPVFPSSWTVGLQEFLVTVPPVLSATPKRSRLSITARHVVASPADTAFPTTPHRSSPFSSTSTRLSSPSPVTSIEHHHPFVVTSRRDNQLDVFEVVSSPPPSPPAPPSRFATAFSTPSRSRPFHSRSAPAHLRTPSSAAPPPPLRLEHRRTLFGHTARVGSVALLDSPVSASSAAAAQAVRCVSAGDDGAVKVWELTPSGSGGEGRKKRRRASREAVVDVQALPSSAGEGEADETAWQRLKRRRLAGVHGREVPASEETGKARAEEDRPERIKRVWVGEDKIVLVGQGGGVERVRVLRFD